MYKPGFWLLCLVLVFSPLAFGTVEPWSFALMEALVLGAFFLVMLSLARKKEPYLRKIPGFLPLSLFTGFILIQLVPLPPFMVRLLSPSAHEIYSYTVWILSQGEWVPLSLSKKATLLEFFRYLSYALTYILTVTLLTNPKQLKTAIAVILSFSSILAVSSIVSHFVSPDLVLGGRETPVNAQPFGPYVNRNHFASFMNMVFPIAVSLLFVYRTKIYSQTFRERISEVLGSREANIQALLLLSVLLLGSSVIVSLSRGGILTLSLTLLALGVVISFRSVKKVPFLIVVFSMLLLVAVWFGWGALFERFSMLNFQENGAIELRPRIWSNSLELIQKFPLVGAGFGAFKDIYRTLPDIVYDTRVEHAHSDYLEFLVNGGILGTGLLLWAFIDIVIHVVVALRKRLDPFSILLTIGSLAGILSMILHGTIETNFASGANGLYFFFLLGLAVSAANTRLKHGVEGSRLPHIHFKRLYMPFAAALLVITVIIQAGLVMANVSSSGFKDRNISQWSSRSDLLDMKRKSEWLNMVDPFESIHYFRKAGALLYLGEIDESLKAFTSSVMFAPLKSEYLGATGQAYHAASETGKAGLLLKASVMTEPANPERYKAYVAWISASGVPTESFKVLRKAISLDPDRTREFISFMLLLGMSYEQQRESLPEIPSVHFFFADHLAETGKMAQASENYIRAREILAPGQRVSSDAFIRAASFFARRESPELAMEFLKTSLSHTPDNPHVRTMMGYLYEKMNMPYSAVQEYKRALSLYPGYYQANEALKRLEGVRSYVEPDGS